MQRSDRTIFDNSVNALAVMNAGEAIKNAPIVEALNAETFVKTAEFGCNTGGHIYNDILTLKNGYIIRIAEDGIGIYANEEDDQTGETAGFANFPETN